MQIPYGIQSYRRADLPQVRLVNCFVEKTDSVSGGETLFSRPLLNPLVTLGSGPIYGLFYQAGALNNTRFIVSGATLFANSTNLGALPASGSVQMTAADTKLLIALNTALWASDGTTASAITFPDGAGVVSVAYLGGYSIAARAGSHRLYFTLDSSTWDGLDYLSAEQSTDQIVGIMVVVDQLWVFCQRHVEIFFLTGDSDAPLQRVQGRLFDKGALSRDSIVKLDNTVFWVSGDHIVYRGDNVPQRISDHGIEERISLANPDTINAWPYPWKGHLFYVLQLSNGTVAYDVATGQWHELATYGREGWRARTGQQIGMDFVVGDLVTGDLYTLSDDIHTDAGVPIVREFTVLVNKSGFIDNIVLDCSTGEQAAPTDPEGLLEMRTSRDGGQTWTDWRQTSLGVQGEYRKRAGFRRVGLVDAGSMVIHFRLTDPVYASVRYIRVNESFAGRARAA